MAEPIVSIKMSMGPLAEWGPGQNSPIAPPSGPAYISTYAYIAPYDLLFMAIISSYSSFNSSVV